MSAENEVRTIPDFVRALPGVDVSQRWERFWEILSDGRDQLVERFDVAPHPSADGREYYKSRDESFEGSFNCYAGTDLEWLVHSWLGNRKNSLLDMNLTAFLGPQTTVPHLRIIFGTFPRIYFSADYVPRRNLWTDVDYLDRYYAEVNSDFLALRGDSRFDWFVSQAPYMRVAESPVAVSISTDHDDEIIDVLQDYTRRFIRRWLGWLDVAETLPQGEQAEQQRYDHRIRELGYQLDPMNQHFVPAFGAEEIERMVNIRMGRQQMAEQRIYSTDQA